MSGDSDSYEKNVCAKRFLTDSTVPKIEQKKIISKKFLPQISRRAFVKGVVAFPFLCLCANSAQALTVKGISYVSISKAAKTLGMKYDTLEVGKKQIIHSKLISLVFEINKRDMSMNGQKVWMGAPVVESKGMLYISEIDLKKTLLPILYPHTLKNPPQIKYVILDAGHGGKDKGAVKDSLFEKNLALDITIRTARKLRSLGFDVSLTRNSDVFLELPIRPQIANANKADFFASIHINASASKAFGVETYALTPVGLPSTSSAAFDLSDKRVFPSNKNDELNVLAAYYVQKGLSTTTKSLDRGVKRARFVVLQTPTMPAVLTECGFISNPSECARLATSSYRQQVADGIANGINGYAKMLKRLKKPS